MKYDELRGKILDRFSEKLSMPFTKSRATRLRVGFENETHGVRLLVSVSSRLKKGSGLYWHGFNQPQIDFLNEAEQGYFIMVFSDSERAFAIPHEKMKQMAKEMNDKSGEGYHVHIHHCKDREFIIWPSKGKGRGFEGRGFEFLQYEF